MSSTGGSSIVPCLRYRDALARHQQNWHRACRQIGAVMVNVIAEEVVADWNLEALVNAGVLKV